MATIVNLTKEELHSHLNNYFGDEVRIETLDCLRDERVTGKSFQELDDDDMRELGASIGERKALKRLIQSHKPYTSKLKLRDMLALLPGSRAWERG